MKTLTRVILLLGVTLAAGVFVWVGAGRALHAVLSIGALGYGAIVLVQLVVFVVLGLAWSLVCPGVKPWVTMWGRLVREGGETCLPFSEVGGLVFGGRAIMLFGADWTLATASSLIDVAAEGTGEAPFVLFGLQLLGAHIGILPAMAIESMLSAVLSVGFLIPGGIGVQEAAYVALGHLFGMPAHLSLLRRARDIGIGVPSLLSWQALEARGLRTDGSTMT
ncbi:hypothetical protein [Lichenicoccus sp.]|uniref:hypothetical protein n=1 Tax=Lichenicoccus sp. TaxID=2781899 RepID=UPI003D119CC6